MGICVSHGLCGNSYDAVNEGTLFIEVSKLRLKFWELITCCWQVIVLLLRHFVVNQICYYYNVKESFNQ